MNNFARDTHVCLNAAGEKAKQPNCAVLLSCSFFYSILLYSHFIRQDQKQHKNMDGFYYCRHSDQSIIFQMVQCKCWNWSDGFVRFTYMTIKSTKFQPWARTLYTCECRRIGSVQCYCNKNVYFCVCCQTIKKTLEMPTTALQKNKCNMNIVTEIIIKIS